MAVDKVKAWVANRMPGASPSVYWCQVWWETGTPDHVAFQLDHVYNDVDLEARVYKQALVVRSGH